MTIMEYLNDIFNKKSNIMMMTVIRILIFEIRHRNPDAVKFIINDYTVNNILENINNKRFNTIMYLYGYKFLLELLKLYEENEMYEICEEIKIQIEKHNILVNDTIPTNKQIKNNNI